MNYSSIAEKIRDWIDEFNLIVSKVKTDEMDLIWNGSAHDKLTENLTDSLSSLKEQLDLLNSYAEALDLVNKKNDNIQVIYLCSANIKKLQDSNDDAITNTINEYKSKISSLNTLNGDYNSQITQILNSIKSVEKKYDQIIADKSNVTLFNKLESNISGFAKDYSTILSNMSRITASGVVSKLIDKVNTKGTNAQTTNNGSSSVYGGGGGSYSAKSNNYNVNKIDDIKFRLGKDDEFTVDLKKLLKQYRSGKLKKIPDGTSLYNYGVSEKVVNKYINEIKKHYSGRDAAVNCVLGAMAISASVGKKLDYDYGGGHSSVTTIGQLMNGVDCSAFVSWAVNQGTSNTFSTRTSTSFHNVGTRESFAKAKPGDILVRGSSGNGGHVAIIIQNDPKNRTFVIAEAYSDQEGVILSTKSYDSCSAFEARDLSSVYDD